LNVTERDVMKTYEKFIEKEAAKLGQMTDGS
jgi:hypothetical protein